MGRLAEINEKHTTVIFPSNKKHNNVKCYFTDRVIRTWSLILYGEINVYLILETAGLVMLLH